MKLKKLTLENFRGFKQFECEFQEGINVLVGLNGQGKSSVLDAIAIAYGQFVGGFGTASDTLISDNDIHLSKMGDDYPIKMESQLPVVVAAESFSNKDENEFPQNWSRQRNTLKGGTSKVKTLKDFASFLQDNVRAGANQKLPLVCYYGTDRLWNNSFTSSGKIGHLAKTSVLEGYTDWLKPKRSFTSFVDWVYDTTMASFEIDLQNQQRIESGKNSISGNIHKEFLTGLRKTLDILLKPAGWMNVRYSPSHKQLVATHSEQGDVPVAMLSDGVRNMIAMMADIAYRAFKLNPHLASRAPQETEGIVLIDEVDMHLHPEWQRDLLSTMKAAFPKIQFIVTTHSPIVISDTKDINVSMLTTDTKAQKLPDLYGQDVNMVLLDVMNTDIRNSKVNEQLNDLLDAIQDSNIALAKTQLAELAAELPDTNIELAKAKLLLRKQELRIAKDN
ncbi:AAA family ATPase [Shewanella sp. 202IG2-18]|uniref:AAA family ATPase n=1 Tax=Parashewanella hymeniacidonis TaxID=2807618 RepID=UPI0019601AB0|nr:AAA family ATPase [Parashewanella hymeniacidonis]MBM7072432.1 AAA family ATPase [Parashewanella hymeniacidonis]